MVPSARNSEKRRASQGCEVIQYTMLQYATGNTTCREESHFHTVCRVGLHSHFRINLVFLPPLHCKKTNLQLTSALKPLFSRMVNSYLEGDVCHGFGQVVCLQTVPVIQVLPQEHPHLERNWNEVRKGKG